MDLSAVRGATSDRRVRVAVDVMGGDHAPEEAVHGALIHARAHPEDDILLVGDEIRVRAIAGLELPDNISFVHASELVAMDEHAAANVRSKRDASINVAMKLVRDRRGRRGRDGGPHGRRRRGRDPPPAPGAGRRPARAGRPDGHRDRARSSSSTSAPRPTRPASSSTSTPRWARCSPSRSWASRTRGSPCSRSARRTARATPGSSGPPSCSQASDLNFIGNVEGKDLVEHMADVVVCDAVVGNVVIKFFEGLSGFIFGLLRKEFERKPFGPPAYLLMRPGIRRIRRIFDYELSGGSPLLGVNGHGDHHPRPGQAADDLVRRGRRRRGRPGRDSRGDRPDLRARAARRRRPRPKPAGVPTPPTSRRGGPVSGPALTIGSGVVRETVRLAALEVPGVLRVGRSGGLLRQRLAGSAVAVRLDGPQVSVRIAIVARPGQSLRSVAGHVRAAVIAALERQLGLVPGEVTVSVDGVGA